jgi:hypothetical protein
MCVALPSQGARGKGADPCCAPTTSLGRALLGPWGEVKHGGKAQLDYAPLPPEGYMPAWAQCQPPGTADCQSCCPALSLLGLSTDLDEMLITPHPRLSSFLKRSIIARQHEDPGEGLVYKFLFSRRVSAHGSATEHWHDRATLRKILNFSFHPLTPEHLCRRSSGRTDPQQPGYDRCAE